MPPQQDETQALGGNVQRPGGAGPERPTEVMRPSGGGWAPQPGPLRPDETVVHRRTPPSFAWLVQVNGMRAGYLHHLMPEGMFIGRDGTRCHIILDDPEVSGLHAKVWEDQNEEGKKQYYIQDLAAKNHTYVNGQEILKCALADGDAIEIGPVKMVFKKV